MTLNTAIRVVLITASQFSILLPVIAGAIGYKNLTQPFRILFYFFLATIFFEMQASIVGWLYHNNMPGLHLFTIVEFFAFSTAFILFFNNKGVLPMAIRINMVILLAIAIADALFIDGIWSPNRVARTYSSVSMLCYALIFLYFMFSNDDVVYSSAQPMFWLAVGVLIYFGSNILYFMFSKDLMNGKFFASKIGLSIHALLNIIAHFLYAQSFRCFRKKRVS